MDTDDSTPTTPQRGGIFREGYEYDFSLVDPAVGAHVDPSWGAIYETDTIADASGTLGPMLTDTGQPDADLLTWRFDVRPGARFHSGAPCDAAALAAAHNSHRDPSMPEANVFFWEPVRDVTAEDDQLVIRLHHPWAGLPRMLRSWHSAVHNERMRAASGSDWGRTVVDGTGPFVHVSTEPGVAQEVARWDDFAGTSARWFGNRGAAYLDGVRWIPLVDPTERAAALEQGEVDAVQNPSVFDVDRLRENPDMEVIIHQQSALGYLALDHETPPFGDLRVRQAISHAIDREAIIASDLAGYGWPAYGLVPSESHWHTSDVTRFNAFDPARSIRLLDEAGLGPDADGVRIEVTALVVQDATVRRVARTLQTMLARIGVRLNLDPIDGFDPFYDMLNDHPPAYVSKWLWQDPVDATVGYVWSKTRTEGPNWQRASIPVVDEACEAFFGATSPSAEMEAAHRLQVLSAEHLPFIPVFFPATVWAHHKRVHGWNPTPTNLYPFYADVWLEQS